MYLIQRRRKDLIEDFFLDHFCGRETFFVVVYQYGQTTVVVAFRGDDLSQNQNNGLRVDRDQHHLSAYVQSLFFNEFL